MRIPIYPAGPLGFSEAGRYFYNRVFIPLLLDIGFDPLDPWKLTDESLIKTALTAPEGPKQRRKWTKVNKIIGANNEAAIRKASIIVAILDGPDVDSGTAGEIGFAAGLGKPVIGYRSDFRLSADNIGSTVNIQIEHFIRMNGGKIVTTLNALHPVLVRWHQKLQVQ